MSTGMDMRAGPVRPTPRRYAPVAAVLTVFGVDLVLRFAPPPALAVTAALDEVAHLSTALLVLQVVDRRHRWGAVGAALLAAVAIDLDHLPQLLGWTGGASRPVTHALWLPAAMLGLAALLPRRRRLLVGIAMGLTLHLLRDAATGGVPAWWPVVPQHTATIPYGAYGAALLGGMMRWIVAGTDAPAAQRLPVGDASVASADHGMKPAFRSPGSGP